MGVKMKIKYSDIEMAFEYVGSDQPCMNTAILDKSTGRIYLHSEMYDNDEEIPEDLWESDSAIKIPHKNDLDLGNQLAFNFVGAVLPDEYQRVRDIFHRRGAYSRFKDFLHSKDMLQQWFDFQNEAQAEAIRDWCKENEIELDDQQDAPPDPTTTDQWDQRANRWIETFVGAKLQKARAYASNFLVHDGLPGKSTATDEYPTEQQGISNFQVNGNVNGKTNVSGPTPSDALDNAAGDSVYVNVSGKDIKPFAVCRFR
jgi:hypothetical protein